MTDITPDLLRSFIERIERLEDEKAVLALDLKEVYQEAKSEGFDPKIIRKVIALRKQDVIERSADEATLVEYLNALGMLAGTPLADAAIRREFSDQRSEYTNV